jgi:hemerythrin
MRSARLRALPGPRGRPEKERAPMPSIQWTDEYSVGEPLMDSQHQKWIWYINELERAIQEQRNRQEQEEILDNLVIYTRYHFASEERMMRRLDFEDWEDHSQVHARMARQVREMQAEVLAGTRELSSELLDLMRSWLVEHIMHEDQQYAALIARYAEREKLLTC